MNRLELFIQVFLNVTVIPLHASLMPYMSYTSYSKVYIYANDTKICREISCHQDFFELQLDIDHIVSWSSDLLLSLHPDKTFIISFCSSKLKKPSHNYHLNGKAVLTKNSGRDLGVYLSSDLSWSLHIQKILHKAYGSFHLIRHTFPLTPTHIKKYLYLASSHLCFSRLEAPTIKDIIALESFQKRATKYILNYPKSDYKS